MACLVFKCGHPKIGHNAMPRKRGTKDVCCRICKAARNLKWRREHPEWQVAENKKVRKQRMSPLLKRQRNRCAICRRTLKYPYEDHDHACCKNGCIKCRRGLLCPSCNGGLHLVENRRLLAAAIAYLTKWA